jgi:TonB family protein
MKAPLPLALLVVVAPALASQSRASRVIDSAFAQVRAGRHDSAEALLRPLLDASIRSQPEEHASALVVYGVVEFFRGGDSAAARAFHDALEIRIDLRGDWMARMDPALGQLWQRERKRAICGTPEPEAYDFLGSDTLASPQSTTSRNERPRVLSGPRLSYPEHLRRARVQGRVVVAAVIDTAGHAERGSIKIVQSPHRAFSEQAKRYVEDARFEPARIGTRPVRACVEMPVDFRIRE